MTVLQVLNVKATHEKWDSLGDISLTFNLLEGFSQLDPKVEVHLICNMTGFTEEEFYEKYPYDNVTIVPVLEEIISHRNYQVKLLEFIEEYVEKHHIDVYHFQQAQSSAASLISKFLDSHPTEKVFFTVHTPPEVRTVQFTYREEFLRILAAPNGYLVAVSSTMKGRIQKALGLDDEDPRVQHIVVVKNSIKSIPQSILEEDTFKKYSLISVGRIDPIKSTLEVLKFYRYYLSRFPESRLLYIGDFVKSTYSQDDSYANACMEILESDPRISWIRRLTRDEVYERMMMSRYSISFSQYETFSLTSCESLAVGTPVIGFDSCGIGELIRDGVNGIAILKIPRKRMEYYYEQIIRRIEDSDSYDPKIVMSTVSDLTSVNMAKNYLNYYKGGI